jgi:hypothetical protein
VAYFDIRKQKVVWILKCREQHEEAAGNALRSGLATPRPALGVAQAPPMTKMGVASHPLIYFFLGLVFVFFFLLICIFNYF